jgi:hypothetical protein
METNGLVVSFVGAAILFAADWQNLPVKLIATLLFIIAALAGFSVKRWRLQLSIFLTMALLGSEWASEHLKAFRTDLSSAAPNLFVIVIVAFVLAYTASLMGGGLRSLFDAGTK